MSLRRLDVLIRGLPPGSGLHRQRGGPLAWSPEERATREASHGVVAALISLLGGKGARPPKPPEPPEVGWWRKRAESQERAARKVRRLKQKQRTQP